jgi:hypothetical protein
MEHIANSIMTKVEKLPEGSLIAAKMFLGLGARAAVDQALSRLHRRGKLIRMSRGMYVLPVNSRFGKRAPSTEKVVEAFASQRGETVAPSAATAANALGLTTQVPVRPIYLTSGRSRKLMLGNLNVELRHAPTWQLGQGHEGEVVRALIWAGRENVKETLASLSYKVPHSELEHIVQNGSNLPSWMIQSMSQQIQIQYA